MSSELVPIASLTKLIYRYPSFYGMEKFDHGVPVIRGEHIEQDGRISTDWRDYWFVAPDYSALHPKTILEVNDIVMSVRGTVGTFARVTALHAGVQISPNLIRISPDPAKVYPPYFYYALRDERAIAQIIGTVASSAVPALKASDIKAAKIQLLPHEQQVSVASALRALDDRITLLRETNTTLEAIAQALFKSWFVDFDPVRAKQAGLAPDGMDEATAALFPDAFAESALGLVPKGWALTPFGQLLTRTIGGDWGSDVADEKNDTRVAIVRGTDIPDLQTGAASRVPIRYTSLKKLASRRIEEGDIVLEVSGGSKDQPTGRALFLTKGLLHQFDCPVEPASFCRLLRPATRDIGILLSQHLAFIYAEGKTWEYQNQSTGIANFQTTHFLEKELVAMPPQEVLTAFVDLVRPLVERTHTSHIRELTGIRDTLLPRLISGQLRLHEAQHLIEEASA